MINAPDPTALLRIRDGVYAAEIAAALVLDALWLRTRVR